MADRQAVPELTGEDDVVDLRPARHALIRDLFDEVEMDRARDVIRRAMGKDG
ncbi:hypothetical protein ACLQ2R_04905 [Streptosporangium sp. DT93]|uniref:hypothetical protein n=1 Tax=Streptosporangium sp. DT93 TaxID=3393428 RepID=UPI003CEAEAD0